MKKKYFIILFCFVSCSLNAINNRHYVRLGARKVNARTPILIPDILGYKTLKVDFHVHTAQSSDGMVDPVERVNEAWREGLDAIAITDHNTQVAMNGDMNFSYERAKDSSDDFITVIKGIEFTNNKPVGHLNFLFISDANKYDSKNIKQKESAIILASSDSAFVCYNHPGWPDKNSDLFDFQKKFMNEGLIQGIEVFNAKDAYPKAYDYIYEYNLAPIGASDTHKPILSEYSSLRPMTLVLAKDNSVESIKEALFARRTIAFSNNILVGRSEYLLELIAKSLLISDFKAEGMFYNFVIQNNSDITYTLDSDKLLPIVIPARKMIKVKVPKNTINDTYSVSNAFVGTNKTLNVSISFLMKNENETGIPQTSECLNFHNINEPVSILATTKGSVIYYTLDGSEPSPSSNHYSKPFFIKESCILKIKAFKDGYESSKTLGIQVLTNQLHQSIRKANMSNGMNFTYYEGDFLGVDDMLGESNIKEKGVMSYFDIFKNKDRREDHFGYSFNGYIYAPKDGIYTFSLRTDDGSVLTIDGFKVVDNDGSHSVQSSSGKIGLKKGFHLYEIKYFDDSEEECFDFYWQTPLDNKLTQVSSDFLFIVNE